MFGIRSILLGILKLSIPFFRNQDNKNSSNTSISDLDRNHFDPNSFNRGFNPLDRSNAKQKSMYFLWSQDIPHFHENPKE